MKKKNIIVASVVLVIFMLVALFGSIMGSAMKSTFAFTSGQINSGVPSEPFIAIIGVNGIIQNVSADALSLSSVSYNHAGTLEYIDQLADSENNCGIFLDLDTPGGGVYESDELYLALMKYKKLTGRPVVAYMNSIACSGGYYVAMAADRIMANRNTETGSIGVIISYNDYSGLYAKLGIQSESIVSGKNKGMGASGTSLTDEQRAILQSVVDESYEQFLGIVREGRKMSNETLLPLADGRTFTAQQALTAGLIDEICTYDEALDWFCTTTNAKSYYRDLVSYTFLQQLFAYVDTARTKSDAEILAKTISEFKNGVPLYLVAN